LAGKLDQLKFNVTANPFGIIYNPVSVSGVLEKLLSPDRFAEDDLFEHLGLWHSFAHHGRFSHPDKTLALANINSALSASKLFLEKTARLVLTLGTAHVFVLKKTNAVVANCHKMPGQAFEKRRLTVEEVAAPLIRVLQKLKSEKPGLEVIVTVSPVRHLRDGLVENQKSKATLLLGLEEVGRELPFVHYFPSYEILLDDLRDYRFYGKDLSHPNDLAVDYIWERFQEMFFTEETKTLCHRVAQIVAAASHKPLHPASAGHQAFLRKQIALAKELGKQHPMLDFTKEKKAFQKELRS